MKKSILALGLIGVLTANISNAQEAKTVDVTKSTISWVGKKITGSSHDGTLSFKEAKLELKENKLIRGKFVVDMESLDVTDLKGDKKQYLVGHLKNDDFFSVDKYKTATLTIKKVNSIDGNKYNLLADLTIKGITKELVFDAIVKSEGSKTAIIADVEIDRTKYDIRYGSASFFDDLGDKTIEDIFTLKVFAITE